MRAPGETVKIEKNGLPAVAFGNVLSQWMDVTPSMASQWLTNNFRNRPVSEETVVAYARDMVNGQWVRTHQGVAFNDADQLIDGQHRLRAIVMSGVTVHMMVTFGLPSKIEGREMTTMDAVDRGRPRSVGDQLVIQHGMKNGSITASICAAIASLCYGARTRRLSVGQTLDVFREFEPAILYVIAHRSRQLGLRATGVLGGFAFALITELECGAATVAKEPGGAPNTRLAEPGSERLETPTAKMFHLVMTGEGKLVGAAKLLREFLTGDEAKLLTRSLDRGLAELVLQAICYESNGRPLRKLEMSLEGADYFRGLQAKRVAKIAKIFKLPK